MSALPEITEAPAPLAVRLTGVSKAFPLSGPSGKLQWLPWARKTEPAADFYALKNIDLEIPAGRSLGILGLNGAGKSTLLSLVAGNIRPTSGQLEVNGRVQLLQLGAGFTPELTARQNVVAYARSRGISKEEIERRVAYVQQFADIGPFFDQPMQTYSSGMRGRVAFGNAFAVDPEILIVDEALAVGDAVFVNKCFRRLNEVRERGTTLLYTSHSTESVVRLCNDGIVLHKGELVTAGTAKEAANAYLQIVHGNRQKEGANELERAESPAIALPHDTQKSEREVFFAPDSFVFSRTDNVDRVDQCSFFNKDGSAVGIETARIVDCVAFRNGEPADTNQIVKGDVIDLIIRVFFEKDFEAPNIGFVLSGRSGESFFGTNQQWLAQTLDPIKKGRSRQYRLTFSAVIAPGNWFVELAISDGSTPVQKRMAMLHFIVGPIDEKSIGPGWLDLEMKSA